MILVTGGTGFVGGYVVHALRSAEKDVRVLVRDPRKAERLEVWGASVARGDVTDAAGVRAAMENSEVESKEEQHRQNKHNPGEGRCFGGSRHCHEHGERERKSREALGVRPDLNGPPPAHREPERFLFSAGETEPLRQ